MPKIILTPDQVKALKATQQAVQLCDDQGNVLRIAPPIWSAEEIADAKTRLATDEPYATTAQVLEHLRAQQ